MKHVEFELAFWHPFGPHSNESEGDILKRKEDEIHKNGWTLWSFQYRPMLDDWHRELTVAKPERVLAFCSSGGGRDPVKRGGPARVIECRSYCLVGEMKWRPMPSKVCVPHTFRSGKVQASAFCVQRIVHPVVALECPAVEWLSKEGEWRQGFQRGRHWRSGIPSRGEYLIRRGGTSQMRSVLAVLELRPPYLAAVSTNPA